MMPILLALLGCPSPTPPTVVDPAPDPAPPASCDAGHEAWVQRVLPLLWGRRAVGAAEVQAWASMADQVGREAVIAGLAQGEPYREWWAIWLTDALAVARVGDKSFEECFGIAELSTHDGSLTQHLRSSATPWISPWPGGSFTMRDVLLDALVADDLAVVWQANLYARMGRPVEGANVSREELEYNRRVNFGEGFYETYLNRNLDCLACHNSSFSVTDAPDARFDRTWQLPGRHETALLGDPARTDKDGLFALFRHDGVAYGPRRPWGMSEECVTLRGPNGIGGPDLLAVDRSFFIESFDPSGSVWDLERLLAAGADDLATDGLRIADDGTVDGRQSFAYLVAARIVDRVFEAAVGGRLTISHGFPRNLEQAKRLEAYTDLFVQSGFSLQALLTAITADDLFNPGLPSECEMQAYGLDPVVVPWTVEDEDPALRGNSPGDLVHRLPARVLLRSAHAHLARDVPQEWALGGNESDFQATLGVFLRESQPGFNGTDFQGLLAFQTRFATCGNVNADDWLADLLARGADNTTDQVVRAIKDHLLADARIGADERALLEYLVGPFDGRAGDVDPRAMRLVCGAMMNSAPYMLTVAPTTSEPPRLLALQTNDLCPLVTSLMASAGHPVTGCD